MLKRILAAVVHALDHAFNLLVVAPLRAIIFVAFPGIPDASEAAASEAEAAMAAAPDSALFDWPEEAAYRRECELESVREWAAERLLGGNPLPDESLPAHLQAWLPELREIQLDKLVSADKGALYAHLFVDMPAAGLPPVGATRQVTPSENGRQRYPDISEPEPSGLRP
jgi:hypothetical protein